MKSVKKNTKNFLCKIGKLTKKVFDTLLPCFIIVFLVILYVFYKKNANIFAFLNNKKLFSFLKTVLFFKNFIKQKFKKLV